MMPFDRLHPGTVAAPHNPRRRLRLADFSVCLLIVTVAACIGGIAPQSGDRDAFLQWASARRTPVSGLAAMVGDAHVVALGEANHGFEEALAFRNEAFRQLVESKVFTAIALETGYAESLRLDDFIRGGTGEAAEIARTSFTSGFGNFQANVDLIEWMRGYNRTATPERQLRIFGIDLSLAGPMGSSSTTAPVECALRALQRASAGDAERLRLAFSAGIGPVVAAQRDFSAADHAAYAAFTRELEAVARRSGDAVAAQCASIALQAGEVHRLAPAPAPGGVPPDAWRTLEARGMAMADNTRWALEQLGPEGRLFVFAHNAHVMNADRRGGHLTGLARPPRSMGQRLRDTLGTRLLIAVESAPGTTLDRMEFGDALRSREPGPFLLDIRAASDGARSWLDQPQRLRAYADSESIVVPSSAFDVVVVQQGQTPARSIRSGQ
jgi:erythromycin esterase